jgi:plasmid stabilization system protein ParE
MVEIETKHFGVCRISDEERNPGAAGDFPEIGQRSDALDVRVILAGGDPYRIYYRAEGGEVVILHIRHTAREALEAGDV